MLGIQSDMLSEQTECFNLVAQQLSHNICLSLPARPMKCRLPAPDWDSLIHGEAVYVQARVLEEAPP
eukprot:1623259-Amphidinium_carterae.1